MDTINNVVVDTIIDSIEVSIPIVQKEYKDSMYHAWVSGYHASLDSIKVFPKNTIITKTYSVGVKKRWGIGPQVGVGYFTGKWTPYIGIGVQYSIFSW